MKCYYESIVKAGRDFYSEFTKACEKRAKTESTFNQNKNSDLWLKTGNTFDVEKNVGESINNWFNTFDDSIVKSLSKNHSDLTKKCKDNMTQFNKVLLF